MPSALLTPRLCLRRWRETDRAPFAAMNADPAVMEFFPARLSRAETDALVDRIEAVFEREGFGLWAIEERESGDFLGVLGLNPVSDDLPCSPATGIGWRCRQRPHLRPATLADRPFLDRLRRDADDALVLETFGGFDQERHVRHGDATWELGGVSILEEAGEPIGMLQLRRTGSGIEIQEIQIAKARRNRGLGTGLIQDVAKTSHAAGVDVVLSTGLKNRDAIRLYSRLGFDENGADEAKLYMRWPC